MNKSSRILVIGASGFVGRQLLNDWGNYALGTHWRTPCKETVYFDPLTMHLQGIPGIRDCSHAVILYGEREPDICWSRPQYTYQLNVESTKRVIRQCSDLGIVPVFASSEMVFSGNRGMYGESDIPDPILMYGKYKVEIEKFLADTSDNYFIIRLSKVMGTTRNDRSIFSNWLAQVEEGKAEVIRCAQDQHFSLIAVTDVSKLLDSLFATGKTGTYHFSDGLRHNRIDLLKILLSSLECSISEKIRIAPVSINDFGSPELRPQDLSMSSSNLSVITSFRFASPSDCVRELLS